MNANRNRIDFHHHFISPAMVSEMARRNVEWTGGAGVPTWSLPLALETMERYDIATGMASLQPQVYWDNGDDARRWAREGNEFIAGIVRNQPDRFGGFASLPLPDTDAALREAEYALDTLRLDGINLQTSYGSQYPGDPAFDELFNELNRRKTVVFFHPNTIPPGSTVPKLAVPFSLTEFVFDTTRTVANLIFSGTLERYPDISFVLPHAGGTVPYLAGRLTLAEYFPRMRGPVPKGVMHYLKRLYYETALSSSPEQIAALRQLVPVSQIVFGSDFPFASEPIITAKTRSLDQSPLLDEADHRAIDRDNALRLFPRLAGVGEQVAQIPTV